MKELGYRIIDCDNHYYEPDDCFRRHIESRYRDRTVWVDRSRTDGFGTMMLGDERLNFFSVGVGDYVGAPGALKAFFKGESDSDGASSSESGSEGDSGSESESESDEGEDAGGAS